MSVTIEGQTPGITVSGSDTEVAVTVTTGSGGSAAVAAHNASGTAHPDIRALIGEGGFRLWDVRLYLIGISVPDLVELAGWGSAATGKYWDDTQQLLLELDQDAETITTLTPREDDLAFVAAVLDIGEGSGYSPVAMAMFDDTPAITEAWLDLSSPATRALIATKASSADLTALAATVAGLNADDFDYAGFGLLAYVASVSGALNGLEGIVDRWQFVSAFSTSNVDLSTLMGPGEVVTQPTLDGGVAPIRGSDVRLFGQTNPAENGAYLVGFDDTDGIWVKYEDPDVFDPPGNGFRVTCNAPGTSVHGVTFMWIDDDRQKSRRVGSSSLSEASASGEWVRLATPSADLTSAPGITSTEMDAAIAAAVAAVPVKSYVVGGQNTGTLLSATTTPTSLLDSTITLPASGAGTVFEIEGSLNLVQNSGATRTHTIGVYLNGTLLVAVVSPGLAANANNRTVIFRAYIRLDSATAADAAARCDYASNLEVGMASADATVAFGSNVTLDVRGSMAANTATHTLQLRSLFVKRTTT